jgi:hypothetical protein
MFSKYIKKQDLEKFNEIEFRFGRYENETFVPGITKDVFFNIYRYCKNNYQYQEYDKQFTRFEGKGSRYKIIKDNETGVVICKKNPKYINVKEYGIRISMCNEEIVENFDEKKFDKTIINKKRTSFNVGNDVGFLDLTIYSNNEHHVEFEIKGLNYSNFIVFILQHLQKNYYILNHYTKFQIHYYLKQIMNTEFIHSISSNVKTLQKYNIGKISNNYAVTNKLDGQRAFLLNFEKILYIIDTITCNVYFTDLSCNYEKSFVLDGEFVIQGSNMNFHIFDILFHDDRDLRFNKKLDLVKRLNIIHSININHGQFFKIFLKKYYFGNVFIASKKILSCDENINENDGLIFTPINECYKSDFIYKWKCVEKNTIDFYSVKKENNDWDLYIQNKKGLKLFENVSIHNENYKEECADTVSKTNFDSSFLDPITKLPYETNTVIEFYWNTQQKKFLPLRTRWDKTANPKKFGNFENVAYDIWYNINNPIKQEFLSSFVKKNCQKHFIENNKQIFQPITKLKNYFIFNKDCEKDPFIIKEKNNNKKFNNIISYNIESCFSSQSNVDNLLNILKVCLKLNGCFTMAFIDSQILDKLPEYKEYNQQVVYFKKIYKNSDTMFGNKVVIDCDSFNINEYIVDFQYLSNKLLECGFEIVKLESFMANETFKEYELFKYCMFKKVKNVKLNTLKTTKHRNVQTFNFDQEYRIVKINSSYNVLDILNCIEYRYNNFDFPNFEITDFNSVEKLFEMYKIDYKPLLLSNVENYTNGFINFIIQEEQMYLELFYETILVN